MRFSYSTEAHCSRKGLANLDRYLLRSCQQTIILVAVTKFILTVMKRKRHSPGTAIPINKRSKEVYKGWQRVCPHEHVTRDSGNTLLVLITTT